MNSTLPDYASYERRKAQWIAANPDATVEQYCQAMNRIARECGV